jgi:hypothetical protein
MLMLMLMLMLMIVGQSMGIIQHPTPKSERAWGESKMEDGR